MSSKKAISCQKHNDRPAGYNKNCGYKRAKRSTDTDTNE